ncbi:MAG: DNA polymerase IV [bacterium]
MTAAIMYLDIDAFFPSVEQVRFPHLGGKPVIVGSGVVASSSYEARRRGVRTGMPIAQAVRVCPEAVVLKGHQHVYASFAEHIFDHCRRLTPAVETYLDEAFCDLAGTAASRRDPAILGREIKAAIKREVGPTVTIGFASNRMIAKLAAKAAKPDGVAVVPPGEEEDFMRDRPVGDVPGIGRVATEALRQINVTSVGDLRRFPLRYLQAVFGRRAFLIHERVRGRDPYVRPCLPKSISRETTFARDTIDREEITATLYYLTERACRAARAIGAVPATVEVRVRYADGEADARRAAYREASVLDRVAFTLANRGFTAAWRRCRVRLVGITLAGLAFPGAEEQWLGGVWDAAAGATADEAKLDRLKPLYSSLDSIRAKFGHSAVIAGRSVNLMGRLERDSYGYVLRTPSLTK